MSVTTNAATNSTTTDTITTVSDFLSLASRAQQKCHIFSTIFLFDYEKTAFF